MNYQFQFVLGVWGLRFCTFSAKKKSGPSELHLTCPEAKLDEKLFLFGLVLILHNCSDRNGKIFESSAKSSLVSSPNCLVRAQTKNSNEVTFFWTVQFQFFFQILGGKFTAVLSQTNSTRPEELMKNDVLIRGSLIPEKDFAIWRRFFGFSLKHFSMVGDTAIYAFRERIQQEIFRNIFCFLIVTGLWVKAFLIFGRIFQRVVSISFYVSRGHLEVKLFFLKLTKTTFFRKVGKKLCHFSTKPFPERLSKKLCSLPD